MKRALRRVGIDWGSESHQVCRIDGEEEPKQRSFPHTSEGLRALVAFVVEGEIPPEQLAIAIEVNHGAVVEALLGVCAAEGKWHQNHSIQGMISRFRPAYFGETPAIFNTRCLCRADS